jgi:hypothetical protein
LNELDRPSQNSEEDVRTCETGIAQLTHATHAGSIPVGPASSWVRYQPYCPQKPKSLLHFGLTKGSLRDNECATHLRIFRVEFFEQLVVFA